MASRKAICYLKPAELSKPDSHEWIFFFQRRQFLYVKNVCNYPRIRQCCLVSDWGQQIWEDGKLSKRPTCLNHLACTICVVLVLLLANYLYLSKMNTDCATSHQIHFCCIVSFLINCIPFHEINPLETSKNIAYALVIKTLK